MIRVAVDYEGSEHTVEAAETDTHVVASTRPDGDLSLVPTETPTETMATAQHAGQEDCRVAAIEDQKAVFTVVPEHDPSDSPVAEAERRNLTLQYAVLAVIVLAIVLAFVLL